ncbi:MAG: hypothetical protein GF353_05345 [Candidatus Lokiarchaeota archaeon]|nr:hypothetical protein [Candidatus Lokiarchaeota archaeon]
MNSVEIISLDGRWTLIQEEKKIKIPATVPGSVFTDLLQNHIIEDPFYGDNESRLSWIYDSPWTFERNFILTGDFLVKNVITLRFLGIDTIAEIFLNDIYIGKTENMFLLYEFNVKKFLRIGKNNLRVVLHSPTKVAKQFYKQSEYKLKNFYYVPGVPFIRKAQYSFGWDIGPKLPDIGIWRSVELIGFNSLRISYIYPTSTVEFNKKPPDIIFNQKIEDKRPLSATLTIEVEVTGNLTVLNPIKYEIETQLIENEKVLLTQKSRLEQSKIILKYVISNPKLWWTNDLGEPHLYKLNVFLRDGIEIIDSSSQNIGIRDLRLIQNPDQYGKSFYFLLNGVPLYAKGANWVPIDTFIPRGKKNNTYQRDLRSFAEIKCNMLRVWGGGIYEEDIFYDLCDELGILVWQDFMFAGSVYPPYEWFFENIKKEIVYNIKRLRSHPSLALWCGNNEIEWYFDFELQNSEIKEEDRELFKEKYIDLFENLIPKLIKEHDSIRSYWPSSPSNGSITQESGFLKSASQEKGTTHYYGVWHYKQPIEKYREKLPRFLSEFGMMSFPSMKTIRAYCPSDQLNINSPVMEYHNPDKKGRNRKVIKYIKNRFKFSDNLDDQVILSQLAQGDGLSYGIRYWRRNRKNYRNMGSLYWQANESYPGVNWGTIDYFGRWKASHYLIKRVFNPIILSIEEKEHYLNIWLINDFKEAKECEISLKFWDTKSNLLYSKVISVKCPACSSKIINSIELDKFEHLSRGIDDKILFYNIKTIISEKIIVHYDFCLLKAPKTYKLIDPLLDFTIVKVVIEKSDLAIVEIDVISEYIAFYVHVKSRNFDFIASDNYFSLEPNKKRRIKLSIFNSKKVHINELKKIIYKEFELNSLYDLNFSF